MPIFSDYWKISCQKLKQNKEWYSQEVIKKYKTLPKNLSLLQVTPHIKNQM